MRLYHRPNAARWLLIFAINIPALTLAEPFIPIPSWTIASSAIISKNAAHLSRPGVDTSSWYTLNATKSTLMATLIANGIYTEDDLFFSTNLLKVDSNQFRVPWYYRSEIGLQLSCDATAFYTLRTNGISSCADIYLNGHRVADKDTQAGAYVGREYDVTDHLRANGSNVLLVKVYPTDYNRDFALGFVDWNPYPPDNGTGIWRDVEVKRSGQVSLSAPRVKTGLSGEVTVFVNARNLAKNATASGALRCVVHDPQGEKVETMKSGLELTAGGYKKLKVQGKIENPQIWWPRQWGEQPLYSVQCNATVKGTSGPSDSTPAMNFGIRTVTSTLNTAYNDTTFYVNGKRFQVLGAGYTSDMFLRFDEPKLRVQFQLVLDMGLNTIRLEGKQEHPRLYELADELGIMLLAGWECCDKWEGWAFNDEGSGEKWADADYPIANLSMRHEAEMMQPHPSILGFLIGSDFWPDDRATQIYVDALKALDWPAPILSSASQRGAPALIGNGGMKMAGPYDWVPPNYWFDDQQRLGAAGGFGSELGAGVGTPQLSSLSRFLSSSDSDDLWMNPNKSLFHMSTNISSFYTREIYNTALFARYGAPNSLEDYITKAHISDYEATKSQFEAYLSRWNHERPATGLVYWMLNNAWPSLHWNLFDYYNVPGGSFYGAKAAIHKLQHIVLDMRDYSVYLVDRRVEPSAPEDGDRRIDIEVIETQGRLVVERSVDTRTEINSARKITDVPALANLMGIGFLRLRLSDANTVLSRNTYHISPAADVLDWENSTWYHTPVTSYADFRALANLTRADVEVSVEGKSVGLKNKSKVPAVFVTLSLVDEKGGDVRGAVWSENYVTLWPGEQMHVELQYTGPVEGLKIKVGGWNVDENLVRVGGGI
ncbi:glycoside hydrolase superfamily [Ampelomyces quisqualis]|uniref:Glycoside hydrolase superfamily n=1 Tax=Ampelomyces quisqualis TaxID=50730 RepID=A0A6A5QTS2_AMPQU|nr:glycoside hydrolase superfamily [Ampelomyces quisqualis]